MKGWCIMPNTGSPKRISPISVPQAGMPEMNDLVPSIGSSTQTYSASVRSAPYSSPRMPWSGKVRLMRARMACSAARSAAVTGSKPPDFLFSTASVVRKNGRMVWPETLASSPTKLAKSMTVIRGSPIFFGRNEERGCRQPGLSTGRAVAGTWSCWVANLAGLGESLRNSAAVLCPFGNVSDQNTLSGSRIQQPDMHYRMGNRLLRP